MTRQPRAVPADAALLGRVAYFAALPAGERRRLAGRCTTRTVEAGTVLFQEGEPCEGLLIVADGCVDVLQVSMRGREQVFHTEGPGATLGEAPLFDGGGYIATAIAVRRTRVLVMPRSVVRDLCHRHPAVALAMLEALGRRVRRFADIIADLAFRPVIERLARYLETAAVPAPHGRGLVLDLPLTQAQLAARLGTVRELVARALGELERAGTIRRTGRRIVVPDRARLRAVARGHRPEQSPPA